MPTVTIGMPVYNGEKSVSRALASLLKQSFQDFCIVVSDNCSTDGTANIVEEICKTDRRVKLVRQPKNAGSEANFMLLAAAIDTPFFMWAAADDTWSQDFLFQCVKNLRDNPEIGFTCGHFTNCDIGGASLRRMLPFKALNQDRPIQRLRAYAMQKEALGKANLIYSLFRTDVINEVRARKGLAFGSWGGDMAFVASALEIAKFQAVDSAELFKQVVSADDIKTVKLVATGDMESLQFGGSFPPDALNEFSVTMVGGILDDKNKAAIRNALYLRRIGTLGWQIRQRTRNGLRKITRRLSA